MFDVDALVKKWVDEEDLNSKKASFVLPFWQTTDRSTAPCEVIYPGKLVTESKFMVVEDWTMLLVKDEDGEYVQ